MKIKAIFFSCFFVCLSATSQNTDVITADQLPAKMESYVPFTQTFPSGVIYSGVTANGKSNTIQMSNNKEKAPRIVTFTNRRIKSIAIEWNSTLNSGSKCAVTIYGKKSKYQEGHERFDNEKGYLLQEVQNGNNSCIDLSTHNYSYIGLFIPPTSSTVYLDKITITWGKKIQRIAFDNDKFLATIGEPFVSPTIQAETTIIYNSSNPDVATVDPNTGKVTLVGDGQTIITATSEETDIYERETAQYTLEVRHHIFSKDFIYYFQYPDTFGYTKEDNKPGTPNSHWDIDITKSLTTPQNDILITTTNGTSNTRFFTDELGYTGLRVRPGGSLTFSVPKGFTIEKCTLKEAHTTAPIKTISADHRSVTFSVPQNAETEICVQLAEINYTGTYELNIGPSGYATWAAQQAYILPHGLQGGIITINSEYNIATVNYCVQPGDIVAPQTALLIKGKPGSYIMVLPPTERNEGKSFSDTENLLRPAITADAINAPQGKQLFIFSRRNQHLGFYWQKGSTCGDCVRNIPNKAYLEVPHCSASNSQGFRLDLDGITGIEPSPMQEKSESRIYSLTGTRVQRPINKLPKGIYIINGKKFFISK